ncbi:MAG TPA: hypothetical protein VGG90_07745, partial [Candidatus Dormibacteraeota bacterium]
MRCAMLASLGVVMVACGGSTVGATSTPTASAPPATSQIGHISEGGVQRSYVVYRPASLDRSHPTPLVVAMHGYTVDTSWMEPNTHLNEAAAADGFVVVYPQGQNDSWNA